MKETIIESIEVATDPNIYKNAMGVIIPGSGGVFSTVDKQGLENAESLLKNGKVSAGIKEGRDGLYIKTVIKAGGHTGEAVIRGRHDHIESLRIALLFFGLF